MGGGASRYVGHLVEDDDEEEGLGGAYKSLLGGKSNQPRAKLTQAEKDKVDKILESSCIFSAIEPAERFALREQVREAAWL